MIHKKKGQFDSYRGYWLSHPYMDNSEGHSPLQQQIPPAFKMFQIFAEELGNTYIFFVTVYGFFPVCLLALLCPLFRNLHFVVVIWQLDRGERNS